VTWWKRHGLSLTLFGIFGVITALTVATGWVEYGSQQETHARPVEVSGFALWWLFEYSMSLVADVFGAILLVKLTKKLREIGSAEDKGKQ
jgi:hypothetical protein